MSLTKIACFSLCGLAVTVQTVLAEESLDSRWYLAPGINYIIADDDRKSDDGAGVRLGLGKAISESFNLELAVTGNQLDHKNTGRYDQVGLGGDLLYILDRKARLTPYGLIGAGILHTDEPNGKHSNAMASLGAGLMSRLTDNGAAMRLEARYRADADSNSVPGTGRFDDWMVGLGLSLPIGEKTVAAAVAPAVVPAPAPAPVVVAAPKDDDNDGVINEQDQCPYTPAGAKVNAQGCEIDSDNDGVVDSKDQCANTPAGSVVNTQGCVVVVDSDNDGVKDDVDQCPNTPAGASVNAQGCEIDSDNDGVVDSKDRCPNTAAGIKVNANGCELDSDNDGVLDSKDKCPDSKAGERVDSKGCKLEDKVVLEGVTFPTGTADLHGDDMQVLNDAAETLKQHPELKVEISGYTDNRGSKALNTKLSQQRAEAVRSHLIGKGVAAEQLTAKGYGPADPVASNGTEEGRQANRRVEMHILSK